LCHISHECLNLFSDITFPSEVCNIAEVSSIARLLFNLGFYSGNRRGEIGFSKLKDFKFGDIYSQFQVWLNQHRLLKSPNSARNIPLEVFWPEHELIFLKEYIDQRKRNGAVANSQLFPDKIVLEKSFELVTLLLRKVTGDQSMRFHHLRHSFANWTWFLLNWRYPKKLVDFICCLSHPYFNLERKKLLLTRLGLPEGASRKKLFSLTLLLGHADISTTLASYLHTMDLFIYLEKNRTSQDLTKLVQLTYGYGAKVSSEFPHEVVGARNFTSEVRFVNRPEISRFLSGFTLDKAYIESFILGEEHEAEQHTNIQNLSVCELLTIVTKMSQHESNTKIANDIDVNEGLLTTVKYISQLVRKSYPKNSQKKLPLLPVDGLSIYQCKIVSSLAKRFDNIVVKPNLSRSLQCMETLAGSKSFLIRSADHQAIAQLLVLLESLNSLIAT
jgi:hypothetical protein